jgi:Glyoxalase-like domain
VSWAQPFPRTWKLRPSESIVQECTPLRQRTGLDDRRNDVTRDSMLREPENRPEQNRRTLNMHLSRLCAVLIDCRNANLDEASRFWSEALGRSVDLNHPGSRDNYRMLETPPDEPIVQIQRVDHESRVHIDIETDDIAAEVTRLTQLGAKVVDRLERWVVMEAPTGQRFCVVRVQRPGFPKNANRWD